MPLGHYSTYFWSPGITWAFQCRLGFSMFFGYDISYGHHTKTTLEGPSTYSKASNLTDNWGNLYKAN